MVSFNKDSSQKDILNDEIDILVMNEEPNDVCPHMFELINASTMDLAQTSTEIPQMIIYHSIPSLLCSQSRKP